MCLVAVLISTVASTFADTDDDSKNPEVPAVTTEEDPKTPPDKVVKKPVPRTPRVVVLTDITNEPDDEQSMVRLLVYSNEFDIEGLIATTSTWLREKPQPEKIQKLVEAYGNVRANLLKHAGGFPEGETLLQAIKVGQPGFGMEFVGDGKATAGSDHLIKVVDREDDPRPVWVCVWGGANTLAQALVDARKSRTTEEFEDFVAKLRVYTISDQDDSGRWMRNEFPKLHYIVSPSSPTHGREYYRATWTGISGDRYYQNGPGYQFEFVADEWLEKHIIEDHGPLLWLGLLLRWIAGPLEYQPFPHLGSNARVRGRSPSHRAPS